MAGERAAGSGARAKMHAGQVDIDELLVERLVATQFPQLAGIPVREVRTTGTVNAIYRLGEELYARMPLVEVWADGLDNELAWLPKLRPHLSLRVPEPVLAGMPTGDYPFTWAVYRWIDGLPYHDDLVQDEPRAALDLAQFVTELRRIDPGRAPRAGRRPLHELDAATRTAIEASRGVIDSDAALAVWDSVLEAPVWEGRSIWIHADLLRPNLLVEAGRLAAVLDFGGAGVGDPAADVIAAWSVFGPVGRVTYRDALGVDDGTWQRARGYALHQAALIIPYYTETNPDFVAIARRTVEQTLAEDRNG